MTDKNTLEVTMRANVNWAAWVGVGASVAIIAIGGFMSYASLQRGQQDLKDTVLEFRSDFKEYVRIQGDRQTKIDDRLRAVEIAQGRR